LIEAIAAEDLQRIVHAVHAEDLRYVNARAALNSIEEDAQWRLRVIDPSTFRPSHCASEMAEALIREEAEAEACPLACDTLP
jgi:hypothetical protein